jgi:hypothetical protein
MRRDSGRALGNRTQSDRVGCEAEIVRGLCGPGVRAAIRSSDLLSFTWYTVCAIPWYHPVDKSVVCLIHHLEGVKELCRRKSDPWTGGESVSWTGGVFAPSSDRSEADGTSRRGGRTVRDVHAGSRRPPEDVRTVDGDGDGLRAPLSVKGQVRYC